MVIDLSVMIFMIKILIQSSVLIWVALNLQKRKESNEYCILKTSPTSGVGLASLSNKNLLALKLQHHHKHGMVALYALKGVVHLHYECPDYVILEYLSEKNMSEFNGKYNEN